MKADADKICAIKQVMLKISMLEKTYTKYEKVAIHFTYVVSRL